MRYTHVNIFFPNRYDAAFKYSWFIGPVIYHTVWISKSGVDEIGVSVELQS
jgi:hypothetical protein